MDDQNEKSSKRRAIAYNGGVLHPFGPGNQAAKGKGHPKGVKNLTCRLRKMGAWKTPELLVAAMAKAFPDNVKPGQKLDQTDAIAARLWKAAVIDGEAWAIREIFDRLDGKPKESVDHTTKGEKMPPASIVLTVSSQEVKDSIDNFGKPDDEK